MNDNDKTVERLLAIVNEMRENAQNMRSYRNLPLADEFMELLRSINDPEEEGIGKVHAIEAIVDFLSEYDVPRRMLAIRRYEQEQLALCTADDLKNEPHLAEELAYNIRKLEDYIDTQHVGTEDFRKKYNRHLKFDPIERTPEWEDIYYDVEQECDRRLGDTPRGMGFCFSYWVELCNVLAERGIEWHSPHELNPRVMFD